MPARSDRRINKRTVDALRVQSGDAVFWDRTLPGFGIRVYASGRKVYVVQARGPAGSRRVALGNHVELPCERARKEAATVIDRIKRGEEPQPPAPVPVTEPRVADLVERYFRVHVATHCSAKTAAGYRYVVDKHILPALGTMRVRDVGVAEVAALHHELRSMPLTANRAVKILSKMFRLAQGWNMVPAGRNPCRLVRRYKEEPRERFLSPDEWRRLGRALREAEADGSVWPQAIAALRLLLLTGCRRQEIVTLKWDDVDRTARELRLRHAKTGPRMVALTQPVERVLDGISRVQCSPWVIPGRKPGTHLADLHDNWERIRDRAGLENMRIHDIRHSYASRALAVGESLTMIGKLLGCRKVQTTARYGRRARDSVSV